jgi:hypothetical protein
MLKILIGTADEITARLAGAPSASTMGITAVDTTGLVLTVDATTSFSEGDPVVVDQQKRYIADITGLDVTLDEALDPLPAVGDLVRHYDADFTKYRAYTAFTFQDDLKTGGSTGDALGREITLLDYDGLMAVPVVGNRVSIYDEVDPDTVLFGGPITARDRVVKAAQNTGKLVSGFQVLAQGYQYEADGVGIEETPFYNVNAGKFLRYLVEKYTTLEIGEIDETDSPRIDSIRLANYRRLSEVGRELASRWPGSEFYIRNDHGTGKIYFRQATSTTAPITLNEDLLKQLGPDNSRIRVDHDATFNMVRLPFYMLQRREPDFFIQTTTADTAFLKTSVTLNGQPTSIEDSILLFDDFSDGDLDSDYLEDDLASNPSPPAGFASGDGYLIEGSNNGVIGLHMLDTSAAGTVKFGAIGRVTDPLEVEPFTGQERQLIMAKEIVVNQLGDGMVLGVLDPTTYQTTATSGSTASAINVADASIFSQDDRIDVAGATTYISSIAGNVLNVSPALGGAPSVGTAVAKHRLAKSRVKFGVMFKAAGDLKYIKDGVETAFDTPRTYSAVKTYSLRLMMQCFETTVSGGASTTGCSLADATNFSTGDVVEIFTLGSRNEPERRVITKSGSNITYTSTDAVVGTGYRVRTLPKMVLQIKGGTEYGDITGRTWTTLYQAANTWQNSESEDRDDHAVAVCIPQSLIGTISLFWMRNPPSVTANIGSRYLILATQDTETTEADVDAIIRKVGNHYQLDFFPDTKTIWSSGATLELRYDEKFRYDLEERSVVAMQEMAKWRGFTLTGLETEQELQRLGGKVLPTADLLPNPILLQEGLAQSVALLEAVMDPGITATLRTNSQAHQLVQSGMTIPSEIPGVPDLQVQRVVITELPAKKSDDSAMYYQEITAGTFNRLQDVLLRRQIKNERRMVIDDGVVDDSFTKLQKTNLTETVRAIGTFQFRQCADPSDVLYQGGVYADLDCLVIPLS